MKKDVTLPVKIETYVGGMLQTNAYLVENGGDRFLVDAPQGAASFVEALENKPTHLLLTHQHFDHSADVSALQEMGLTLIAGEHYNDDFILRERGLPFGIHVPPFAVDEVILKGNLVIGDTTLEIRHVPGHSPDSIVFYSQEHGIVFGGDTLFAGGIGRPDLPGGNYEVLMSGIQEHLMALPGETLIYPGHGPETTIAAEARGNGYLQ